MSATRRLVYGGLVVIGLVAAGVLVFALIFRDTATPVTREDVTGTGVLAGTEPGDPGIYTYATSGGEEVDALGGAAHTYPAESYAILRDDGCGMVLRWQPLEERFSEWTTCDGDITPTVEYSLQKWFGVPEYTTWTCVPDGPVPPVESGATWTDTCDNGDSTEHGTFEVVGFETLTIGGEPVETVRLRRSATSEGRTVGTSTREDWVATGSGLLVRRVSSTASSSSSAVGSVRYTEDFTIELTGLDPGS